MNPRRVTEEFPQSLDAQLLRAGRELGPPPGQLHRTLLAVTLLAANGSKAAGLAVTIKWAAAGIVSGVALVGAVAGARIAWSRFDHQPPSEVTRPSRMDGTSPIALTSASAPIAEPSREPGNDFAAGRRTPMPKSFESARAEGATASLGQEVAMIDRVRSELRQQHARRALALLDEHALKFPTPRLAEEAAYLRVLALDGAGRTQEAARATERFRERFPTSPLLTADAPKESPRESL